MRGWSSSVCTSSACQHLSQRSMWCRSQVSQLLPVAGPVALVAVLQKAQTNEKHTCCSTTIGRVESHNSTISDITEQVNATDERLDAVAKHIAKLDDSAVMATKMEHTRCSLEVFEWNPRHVGSRHRDEEHHRKFGHGEDLRASR